MSDADMVRAIRATLAELYARLHASVRLSDREMVLQKISVLENSLRYWEARVASQTGARPRCASVDISGC